MKRAMVSLFAVLATFVLLSVPAFAQTQLVLHGSSTGMTFTSGGTGNPIAVCQSGCTLSGSAVFEVGGTTIVPTGAQTANYSITFTAGTGTLTTSDSGLTFTYTPGTTTATFHYFDSTGNDLTADLTLTSATGGSTSLFVGTLSNVVATGSTAFTDVFQSGVNDHIDWTISPLSPSLMSLWTSSTSGDTASGKISSGEVYPVPEPVSMLLLGSGLLGLGFLRRKLGSSA